MLGFDPGVMPTQGVDAEGVSVKLICCQARLAATAIVEEASREPLS